MNNDLISRNKLKEDLIKFFPKDCLEGIESKTLFNQILTDIDNAPTVEYPFYAETYQTGYEEGRADEYHAIMDILNRCGVTVCMEDKQLITIAEYIEKRYEELGSRKPQQKTGEWIEDYQEDALPFNKRGWICSNCNSRTSYGTPPFCMRCGAKMEVKA